MPWRAGRGRRRSAVISSLGLVTALPMQPRLLLVFAHPDDETVFAAGVTCQTVAAGGRVALCTATPGENGKLGDPPACARGDLARFRQAELMDAPRFARQVQEAYRTIWRSWCQTTP